jgi:chromatin segregation and condensation protein Rec8/ScpA/Scc1 (kleisin family)
MKSGAIRIAQEEIFGDIQSEMTGEGTVPVEISFEGA